MPNTLRHKRSSTASAVPSAGSLAAGELAVNTADGRVYLKRDDNAVIDVGATRAHTHATTDIVGLGTIATQAASSVAVTGGTINGTSVGATTASTGAFTTVTTTGNVGIGTASPTQRLDVWGAIQSTANVAQARLLTASGVGWRIVTASSGTTFDEFLIQGSTDGFATVAATPLRISTAGNVGIGTGTPAARLDVRRTNNYTVLGDGQFTSAEFGPREQNDGFCSVRYSWSTYGSGNNWGMDCGSDRMTFAQIVSHTRTEWMTLRSNNLGIGTNNPTLSSGVGLHISGSTMRLGTARTPASSTATGNTGEICWDSSYLYVCTATNTWRRIAHSSW